MVEQNDHNVTARNRLPQSTEGIIQKLSFYGVQHKELNWFKDYLFNRHQVVMFNNFQSKSYPVTCGVPQGSILGPLLFLVYFNDFIKVVKHSKVIKYADDTVLYIGSSEVDDIQRRRFKSNCTLVSSK